MDMPGKYVMCHKTDPPAHYDVMVDKGDSIVTFRIAQFDMMALLDGTEVRADEIPGKTSGDTTLDEPIPCDRGNVRIFDSGTLTVEQWGDPVIVLNIVGRIFSGTLHLLKTPERYSMRFIRSRREKK
jgi:hypothetical protein